MARGASALADALTPGHGLHTLYLGCNRIDADGATALADLAALRDTAWPVPEGIDAFLDPPRLSGALTRG
ncbi:hypothetical protein KIK06_10015 [Nocardiopsis sp. EMB25]|uniref:hypothetical protein n=1 Tax=Nocardiopsis TaxID=2013 RepID=UPI00034A9BE8|nr:MULTISPECIES: hypothetical protein [Nocardiopsis]MCY9784228.1 hypothetical protein [Nocardiopsis sp. EMB25]